MRRFERSTRVLNVVAEDWDARASPWLAAPRQRLWRRHSDAVNGALIERWLLGRPARVLKTDLWDEAVGDGLYPTLAERAEQVVGIDISATVVETARRRHAGLSARTADVRALPFENDEFDAVLSNSTLDHFDSRDDVVRGLRECVRVLRPSGQLIVTLDNPWNPVIALTKLLLRTNVNRIWPRLRLASSIGLLPYRVGVTFSITQLRDRLTALALDVRDTCTIVHAPRAVAVVVAELVERHAHAAAQERFLRALMAFEAVGKTPVGYVTGHFIGARALKR